MLNPRLYRAAFLPVMLAVAVVAFSLRPQPAALQTSTAADAFDGARASADLAQLATRFPDRRPGSAGDGALAKLVAARLRADQADLGEQVRIHRFSAETAVGERTLETVTAERPGISTGRIVVVADRSALASPATASLSGTEALLELSRVFRGRTPNHTLELVSTSGGAAGTAELARRLSAEGDVDAVLVLGDLAGTVTHRPVVVGWSAGSGGGAPAQLVSTVDAAVRSEAGLVPRSPGLLRQFAHLALPLTTGAQGPLLAAGAPAVLLQVSGERGPGAATDVSPARFDAFGRAALHALTALDESPAVQGAPDDGLPIHGQVIPGWTIRLLVATLLLPALLAVLDGFARARRRRVAVARWLAWVLAGAAPFLLAALFARLLGTAGAVAAPVAALTAGSSPLGPGGLAALAGTVVLAAAAWIGLRAWVGRRLALPAPEGGAATALGLVLVLTAAVVWLLDPFAAALLLPAVHVWLLVADPEMRPRRGAAVAAIVAALVPVLLLLAYYADQLGAGPVQAPWTAFLLFAGGALGPLRALLWSLVAGCLVAALTIAARPRSLSAAAGRSLRGPVGYAGPGSLGGTESALRR